jgi:hypothetical protein
MEDRGPKAFQFFGKTGKNVKRIVYRNSLSKANVVLAVVDAAIETVQAGISHANYRYEKGHTERLKKELADAESRLDEALAEEKLQIITTIEENRKRLKAELERYKVQLQAESDRMIGEIDLMKTMSEQKQAEYMKEHQLQERMSKAVVEMLDFISQLIKEEMNKDYTSFEHLAMLNEDYRLTLQKYEKLIKQAV